MGGLIADFIKLAIWALFAAVEVAVYLAVMAFKLIGLGVKYLAQQRKAK